LIQVNAIGCAVPAPVQECLSLPTKRENTMARLKTLLGLLVLASALLARGGAVAQTSCVITCPANATVATAPGALEVAYPYTVTTSGTCGGIVQLAGIPPGGNFGVGTTTNVWRANDPPQPTCQFTVTVTATPAVARPSEPIPALGPLALGLLAVALAGGGMTARRRSTRR